MTMPHLMNCPHSEDGWCLRCVEELYEEKQRLYTTTLLGQIIEALRTGKQVAFRYDPALRCVGMDVRFAPDAQGVITYVSAVEEVFGAKYDVFAAELEKINRTIPGERIW